MQIDHEALNDPDALYVTTQTCVPIGLVASHNLPQFLRDYWANHPDAASFLVSKTFRTYESWHAFHEEDPF